MPFPGARTYVQEVLADFPHRYLRLCDSSTQAFDLSAAHFHGSHVNGVVQGIPNFMNAVPTDQVGSVQYDGINDYTINSMGISVFSRIQVECWLYWTATGTDDKLAYEYGTPAYAASGQNGFVLDPNNSNTDTSLTFVGLGNGGSNWADGFPKKALVLNSWNHIVCGFNRIGPVITATVNGVPQPMVALARAAASGGSFGNTNLYLMSRTGTAIFCPPGSRMQEFAVYGSSDSTVDPLPLNRIRAHIQAALGSALPDKLKHTLAMEQHQSGLLLPAQQSVFVPQVRPSTFVHATSVF